MQLSAPIIQSLTSPLFNSYAIDVLRLDVIHPVVSGNKWFKLKYNLKAAIAAKKDAIATFGGAYSNHIVAAAYACKDAGINSIGVIRGEKSTNLSPTLLMATSLGMHLIFVNRDAYKQKTALIEQLDNNYYWVNEGGFNDEGMKGASEILQVVDTTSYTHIICACGTGTMMAGLVNAALPHQQVIGISALKAHDGLADDIKNLLPDNAAEKQFHLFHNYHFGGYAKHPSILIDWMKELWLAENLPTDIVYTSKLLYAVKDLCNTNFFMKKSKILIIHSGGLQGNNSLPIHTLPF